MPKMEVTLTSTAVDGDYGIVDVYFNDVKVEENLVLNADGVTITHQVIPKNGDCEVTIDLLNDKATDYEGDGQWDEIMDVRIVSAKWVENNNQFTPVLPHGRIEKKNNNGEVVEVIEEADHFSSFGRNYKRSFPVGE